LVVVGPCSIHDPEAALDYAKKLKELIKKHENNLFIVMRVYFEKPRTTIGWKGLINDPNLDNTYDINKGLRIARKLLIDITNLDIPIGCEFLDVVTPQYLADLVSWGAIGARTTESQVHRQLASGLSMPVGFKNGTGGSIDIAADAVLSSQASHVFLGVTETGMAAKVTTVGNKDSHIILRGGKRSTNYDSISINNACNILKNKKIIESLIVDCSHGNSQKIHTNQILVARSLSEQIENGDFRIVGVMIESNIKEGNQKLTDSNNLEYGKSITDACVNLITTDEIFHILSNGVEKRNSGNSYKRMKFTTFENGINYLI